MHKVDAVVTSKINYIVQLLCNKIDKWVILSTHDTFTMLTVPVASNHIIFTSKPCMYIIQI